MTNPDVALPSRVDVLVVGADLAGRWAARGLARAGASVWLAGGDGPPPGLVSTVTHEAPHRLVEAVGPEVARTLLELGGRSAEALGLTRSDAVWVASGPGEAASVGPAVDALRALGFVAEALDRAGLDARGIDADAGFVIARGAARLDRLPEVDLPRTAATPTTIDDALDGVCARFADGRAVRADVVVLAGAGVDLRPGLAALAPAVFEHEVRLDGPPGLGHAGHGWTTFRPASDGVWVRGARWATPDLGFGRTEVAPAVVDALAGFGRRHLRAGVVREVRGWIERHGCDGLPVVGPLPGAGRWIACFGFGADLAGFGPAAADRLVAALTGDDPRPVQGFAPSRFVG